MKKGMTLRFFTGTGCLLIATGMLAWHFSVMRLIISVVLLFIIVKALPMCSGYESLWLFVLTVIGSIPINARLVVETLDMGLFYSGIPVIGAVMTAVEVYLCALAVEEIVIGVLGRILWKMQRNLVID